MSADASEASGPPPRIIVKMGDKVIRTETWPPSTPLPLAFTPSVKASLENAIESARARQRPFVGTEDILLGLLREGQGKAARLLAEAAITRESAEMEIQRVTADPDIPSE